MELREHFCGWGLRENLCERAERSVRLNRRVRSYCFRKFEIITCKSVKLAPRNLSHSHCLVELAVQTGVPYDILVVRCVSHDTQTGSVGFFSLFSEFIIFMINYELV